MNYLPAESAGGVELSAKGGKIRVSSTLESRLELIANQVGLGTELVSHSYMLLLE